MFRRLESINGALEPKMYVNTYLTVQTDRRPLPIIKTPTIVSVPNYSKYNKHQETPEYKALAAAEAADDNSVYKALMPHGRYNQPSVDFSRIAVLAAKTY